MSSQLLIESLKKLKTMLDAGEVEKALSSYEALLKKEPNNASIWVDAGIAYRKAKQYDNAITAYTKALGIRPDLNAVIQTNIGNIFLDQQQYDAAIACYQQTLSEQPTTITARINWGHALYGKKQWELAIEAYQTVLKHEPTHADAHFHLSLCYLMLGDYLKGFAEYEWRWKRPSVAHLQHHITQPPWNGELIREKTLFIHCEQGFGDLLQFARFVSCISSFQGKIIMECPDPLFRLFQSLQGVDYLFPRSADLAHFDYHIPLLSLPYTLKTTYQTVPQQIPYLSVDEKIKTPWKERLNDLNHLSNNITNIGFVWAGSLENPHTFRSTSLNDFTPLFQIPHTRWFNLQIDSRKQALKAYPNVIDLTEHIHDFADTAASIMQCDLIISIDTAVAHLAGSLGIPCWVLLADPPDWRWGEYQTKSHWYPNTHLFRQIKSGNWEPVFKILAKALTDLTTIHR